MAKNCATTDPYMMASQPFQRESCYTMAAPSNQSQHQNQQSHSSMPPPLPHPDYQSTSYTLPLSPPMPGSVPASAPLPAQTPTDPLEQRILDLLYPYRDECFLSDDTLTETRERDALILCENIAFLVRHNQSSYGKLIEPNDVSVASRGWQSMKKGKGVAGICVFVNGNGFSHTVVRTTIGPGDGAVERLIERVDMLTQTFFPEAGG